MIHLNRSRKSVDISTFFRVQDDSTILNTHCTILHRHILVTTNALDKLHKKINLFLSILTVEMPFIISYNIDSSKGTEQIMKGVHKHESYYQRKRIRNGSSCKLHG